MSRSIGLRRGLDSTSRLDDNRSAPLGAVRHVIYARTAWGLQRSFIRKRSFNIHASSSLDADRQNGKAQPPSNFYRDQPSRAIFPVLAKALVNGDFEKPDDLFSAMDKLEMISTVGQCNHFLIQLRRLRAVKAMIDFMTYMNERKMERNGNTYAIIISACRIESDLERACLYFDQLKGSSDIPATVHSYQSIIGACISCSDLERAREYVDEMVDAGVELDAAVIRPVFQKLGYEQQHPTKAAREICVSSLWAYSNAGYAESLSTMYETSKKLGIKFNFKTYHVVFFGLGKKPEHLELAVRVLEDMKKDGIRPELYTYHLLLRIFAAARDEVRALALIEEMEETGANPTLVTYNSILASFSKTFPEDKRVQMWHSIDDLVERMRNQAFLPDCVFYRTVLGVCVLNCSRDRAERYLQEMKENDVPFDNKMFVKLIKLEAQCDCEGDQKAGADRISALFERMDEEGLQLDRPCCVNVMYGFLRSKSAEKIQPFVEKMQQAGIRYDSLLLKQLLEFWFTVGDEEMASKVIEEALGQGLSPNNVNVSLLRVLIGLKRISAVIQQLQKMKDGGFNLNVTYVHSILNELKQANLSEEARAEINAILGTESPLQES